MFRRAISFALDNYDFELLVKLDTDAIITGPGFSSALAGRVAEAPGTGIAGSYRERADGKAEDHLYHAAVLARERRWDDRLDAAARRAEERGWRTGDAVQAGVLTLTRAACESMRDDGWLDWRPAWHSQMAEDLLLTLFTVAGGLDALSIGGPDGIIAVANKGLPGTDPADHRWPLGGRSFGQPRVPRRERGRSARHLPRGPQGVDGARSGHGPPWGSGRGVSLPVRCEPS